MKTLILARRFEHKCLRTPADISVYNFHRAAGFTLIELLVVVIIIGIAISIAAPKLFPDESERLRQETDRALAMIETARDESAFSGRTIALNITDNTLTFYERDVSSTASALASDSGAASLDQAVRWLPTSKESLRARPFSEGIRAALVVGAGAVAGAGAGAGASINGGTNEANKNTLALLQPSGVGMPFEIELTSTRDTKLVPRTITVDALGNFSLANDVR